MVDGGRGVNLSCTSCRLEEGSGYNGQQFDSVVDGSIGLDGILCAVACVVCVLQWLP